MWFERPLNSSENPGDFPGFGLLAACGDAGVRDRMPVARLDRAHPSTRAASLWNAFGARRMPVTPRHGMITIPSHEGAPAGFKATECRARAAAYRGLPPCAEIRPV